MTLQHTEKAELHQYWLVVGRQRRSHQGPTLEKQWMSKPWDSRAALFEHFKGRESLIPAEPYFKRNATGPLTADITAEQRIEPSTELDLHTSDLLGRVSRKIERLCKRHQDALEAFHGDAGAYFESIAARVGMAAVTPAKDRAPMYGRIASLFKFTQAGREIIRRARRTDRKQQKLSDDHHVQAAVAQDDGNGASTLTKAHEQALALLERAEKAYARAGLVSGPVEVAAPIGPPPSWAGASEAAYATLRAGPRHDRELAGLGPGRKGKR